METDILPTLLCPYVVGQIIDREGNGKREIVTHISHHDGKYQVYTEILANQWRYYEVDETTRRLVMPEYSRFNRSNN